ncbi:MAG: hypothetical protein Q7T55_13000 [Solirubrobacteraceae bacterium]|nr:hypothetical protein [Solirubrobacteraceae bacterium]
MGRLPDPSSEAGAVPDPEAVSARIFVSTEALLGTGGVSAVTMERVADATALTVSQLRGRFANVESLVFASALRLAGEPVIHAPHPLRVGTLALSETAEWLVDAHRRYVDERPSRFAALHELGGAALFGFPSLRRPLVERNRRTCEAMFAHLGAAWDVEREEDLRQVAATMLGTFNGIELCFLDDANAGTRDAAYREAVAALGAWFTTRG